MFTRSFFSILIVACEFASGYGQTINGLAIKAGLNIATTNENNSSAIVGFIGGGHVTFGLTDIVAIQPEVVFTMKGQKLEEFVLGLITFREDIRLNYLEVPLLAKLIIPTHDAISPSLLAGPFFSVLVGRSRGTDLGICFGADVNFELLQLNLITEARYSLSLKTAAHITTTVTNSSGEKIYENSRDVRNRVISLLVGVWL